MITLVDLACPWLAARATDPHALDLEARLEGLMGADLDLLGPVQLLIVDRRSPAPTASSSTPSSSSVTALPPDGGRRAGICAAGSPGRGPCVDRRVRLWGMSFAEARVRCGLYG